MRAPEAVINGKLLACSDFPETVEEHLPADSAHGQIRIAAMIDELSATSSDGSIEHRAPIQANRVNPSGFPAKNIFAVRRMASRWLTARRYIG